MWFDLSNLKYILFKRGPDLRQKRRGHSCGILWNESESKNKVVITGGKSDDESLFTTEYLEIENYTNGWQYGPNLKHKDDANSSYILEDSTTYSLYLVTQSKIYRIFSVNSDWDEVRTLDIERKGHVAMFLPGHLFNEMCPNDRS